MNIGFSAVLGNVIAGAAAAGRQVATEEVVGFMTKRP